MHVFSLLLGNTSYIRPCTTVTQSGLVCCAGCGGAVLNGVLHCPSGVTQENELVMVTMETHPLTIIVYYSRYTCL